MSGYREFRHQRHSPPKKSKLCCTVSVYKRDAATSLISMCGGQWKETFCSHSCGGHQLGKPILGRPESCLKNKLDEPMLHDKMYA